MRLAVVFRVLPVIEQLAQRLQDGPRVLEQQQNVQSPHFARQGIAYAFQCDRVLARRAILDDLRESLGNLGGLTLKVLQLADKLLDPRGVGGALGDQI